MSKPGIPTQCRRNHRNPRLVQRMIGFDTQPQSRKSANTHSNGKTTTEQRRRKQTRQRERRKEEPRPAETPDKPRYVQEASLALRTSSWISTTLRSTDLRHAATDFRQGGGMYVDHDAPLSTNSSKHARDGPSDGLPSEGTRVTETE